MLYLYSEPNTEVHDCMKIAVFSDTHGRTRGMLRAIRNEAPDLVFHLGDNEKDALSVNRQDPV